MHMHAVEYDRIDACNLGLNLSPLNIYTYTSIKLTPLHSLSFDIYTQSGTYIQCKTTHIHCASFLPMQLLTFYLCPLTFSEKSNELKFTLCHKLSNKYHILLNVLNTVVKEQNKQN